MEFLSELAVRSVQNWRFVWLADSLSDTEIPDRSENFLLPLDRQSE